ncbi:RNA ligase-domain-containing protein [Naematelia encephala]|uniref:RNA ligase-domain-containing protein n=1 Tax=Naematelia encephala TaxID=71784 RepID=A0A1Y2ATM6_9TREE|nr:RNA ligase-domain-containing protein [Naematelia encephala]
MPSPHEKHPASTSALLASLRHLQETDKKAVRSNVHIYPASVYAKNGESSASAQARDRHITSWKMTEHMYFNADNPFPTLARGLFTMKVEEGEELPAGAEMAEDRIVARGYDKFFNIDEVEWTNWSHMHVHTEPPYRLTLKSNGCLILIAALSPEYLVVASKHSLGTSTEEEQTHITNGLGKLELKEGKPIKQVANKAQKGKDEQDEERESRTHAAVGRDWLRRTLKAHGKTEAELARRLWDLNSTAVLELCDDSFEEHVIATPQHWTGLHLHGLNYNTPHFSTAPPSEVSALAEEFGFIPTKFVEFQTLDDVKAFTDEVAKTGSWEGDQIEGFVVRCVVKDLGGKVEKGRPPYRPGAPFFFKVKFEEPYMLYRQWREMTRIMLPLLGELDTEKRAAIWKRVRSRTKRPEAGVYAEWCGEMIEKEPKLFDDYDRGVVRVRERFLEWTDGEGKRAWNDAKAGKWRPSKGNSKQQAATVVQTGLSKMWLIVPIAVPGWKTQIGLALSTLFGFGHTQSDDVMTKRTAPGFLKNITELFARNDVVYADRNNHIEKHYDELSKLGNEKAMRNKEVHLIGLLWDIDDQPYHRLLRICSERVVNRGDNHQTLRPDLTMEAEHEAVVGQFLRAFTPPDPALFDRLIPVHVQDSPVEALRAIIDGLVEPLCLHQPTDDELHSALDAASQYKVTTPYHAPSRVGKPVRYFGVAPEIDLGKLVESVLASQTFAPELASSADTFLKHLQVSDRITAKSHITLVHEKTVQAEKEANGEDAPAGLEAKLWETCKSLAETPVSPLYDFDVTHLVWNDRVMALIVDNLRPQPRAATAKESQPPELELSEELRGYLHLTVGTRTEEISAFESRGVTRSARERIAAGQEEGTAQVGEGAGDLQWVRLNGISGSGRIRGMY